jgi:hypothetical protein
VSARRYTDDTTVRYGGDFEDVELDPDMHLTEAIAIRPFHQVNHALYTSLFAGDTISMNRLTINAALRFDRATSSTDAIHLDAHPIVPQDLPAVDAPAVKNAVIWNTWSPRVGITYAIGANRRTIGRASYSSFAGQLNAAVAGNISAASYAYSYYLAVDRNNDFEIDPSELGRFLGSRNIIASDPSLPVNQIDPNYRAPRTHEIAIGIDHQLMAHVGGSATYTWPQPPATSLQQLPALKEERPLLKAGR